MSDTAAWPVDDAEKVDDKATGPPLMFVAFAAGCVLIALVMVFVDNLAAHIFGYFLASIMTVIAVGFYRRIDLTRRLSTGYRPQPLMARVIPILLVVAFIVSGFNVWSIATELAS